MTACLGDLERFLHETVLPPLVQVALLHYQFEAIHPFLDGNGRVGRLLVTLFLVQRGILPTPLLYLSAFFEATRREYYEGLQGVIEHGEWERWLGYFLNGVARQSEDALGRAERINRQLSAWRLEIAGISSKGRQVKRSDSAIGSTAFYGRISTIVPFGANLSISSISWSVTAIHPFVQSTPA